MIFLDIILLIIIQFLSNSLFFCEKKTKWKAMRQYERVSDGMLSYLSEYKDFSLSYLAVTNMLRLHLIEYLRGII